MMLRRTLGIVLLSALLGACDRDGVAAPVRTAHADAHDAGRTKRPKRVTIDVVRVVARPFSATVHFQGELLPYFDVAIFPRVSGFVEVMDVDRASEVRRGERLALLVAPELVADRAQAEATLAGDRSTLERLSAASVTPGVVARHDLELAQAAVDADEARLRSLRDLVSFLRITAPFDGVVTERNVHPGALVGPSTTTSTSAPMLRLQQVSRLRLTAAVPEQFAVELPVGASARFTVRAWPNQDFVGRIVRPAHSITTRTRTMPVELDVDNSDGRLAPGMYADVAWPVRRAQTSILVPPTAIVQTTERTFVVRVRGGTIDHVAVERGIAAGPLVEVFGELSANDLVALRGNEELREGMHVKTRTTDTPEAPSTSDTPSSR